VSGGGGSSVERWRTFGLIVGVKYLSCRVVVVVVFSLGFYTTILRDTKQRDPRQGVLRDTKQRDHRQGARQDTTKQGDYRRGARQVLRQDTANKETPDKAPDWSSDKTPPNKETPDKAPSSTAREMTHEMTNKYLIVRYDRPGVYGPDPQVSVTERRLPEYDALVLAVNSRLESLAIPWKIRSWQAAVAAECLAGRDVVVKAQTGSGKSMCYYSLAMMHPEDCILVICPLLALMADQVSSAQAKGITTAQLSAETIRADPQLLHRVREGRYSMVLVSAEFTASEAWKSLIRDDRAGRRPNFAMSLRRIIIDEAHLVREW
jgi:hypothetical protein